MYPDLPNRTPALDHLITDYGAVPDDGIKCRAAIQSAIDACAKAGGGRVIIPPGNWLTGSLRLRSNVEFYLAPGALLMASGDESAFPELSRTENLPGVIRAVIWADGEQSISITGSGMIHGDGDSGLWGDEAARTFFRPALVFLRNCRGILLRDVRLYYSQFWTCHLLRCHDVVIDAVDIRTHRRRINADGIDPDGCTNVRISNCLIDSTDDAICLKSTEGDVCEDIVISNCIVASRCAGIKLGTESIGPIRNVHVSNCIIRESDTGIAFYQKDRGGFQSVTFSNLSIRCHGAIAILIDNSRRWRSQEGLGEIRSLLIENTRCQGPGKMLLRGHPEAPLRDIALRGVSFMLTGPFDFSKAPSPTGSRRSERDPAHGNDIPRPFQAIITDAINVHLDDFSVADARTEGKGDRGIAYLRGCKDVTGSWTHGLDALPQGGAVVVEDSSGIDLKQR
jgi:hypothetical protein